MDEKFTASLNSDDAQEVREYFESIIAVMPGHVYWKDKNGVLLGCNDQQAKSAGLASPKDIVGKTDYDLPWKAQADTLRKADTEVMRTGIPQTIEEASTLADGTQAMFLSKKVPFYHKGRIIGIIGISIDITERKQAEQREKLALTQAAEAKAKAEGEAELRQAVMVLAGSIAHDLRTPIMGLSIQGRVIQKYWPVLIDAYHKAKEAHLPIETEARDMEYKIDLIANIGKDFEQTAQRMNEFINVTLKTLSKTVSGELTQEDLVPCSIWHCVHNTLESYPFAKGEREFVHWEQHDNFTFLGNEVLVIRMLSNLLSNALYQIKKSQRGEIFIVNQSGLEANTLRFKDTAGGAPPEIVARLFDGYRTTKEGGTGIGLAFCKFTMQSFGGDITCHSVYGDYMEFILSFPKL